MNTKPSLKPPERSVEPREIAAVVGIAGARNQVQTPRLVGTFGAEPTTATHVAGAFEPDPRERDLATAREPVDDGP